MTTDITTLIANIRAWQATHEAYLEARKTLTGEAFTNHTTRKAGYTLDVAALAVTKHPHDDHMLAQFVAIADEIERLQEIETHAYLGCRDCGLPYGSPSWMDAVVSNEVWKQISPTGDEGGLLCIACIARRCHEAGLEDVPVLITSGSLVMGEVKATLKAGDK